MHSAAGAPPPPSLPMEDVLGGDDFYAQRQKVVKEQRAREEKLRKDIKRIWIKHPELVANPKDSLGEKLEDFNEHELEIVKENMLMDAERGKPLSPSEEGLLRAWAAALEYPTGANVTEEILQDETLKADLRELTGGYLTTMPSWLSFITRSGMILMSKLEPMFLLPSATGDHSSSITSKTNEEGEGGVGVPSSDVIRPASITPASPTPVQDDSKRKNKKR